MVWCAEFKNACNILAVSCAGQWFTAMSAWICNIILGLNRYLISGWAWKANPHVPRRAVELTALASKSKLFTCFSVNWSLVDQQQIYFTVDQQCDKWLENFALLQTKIRGGSSGFAWSFFVGYTWEKFKCSTLNSTVMGLSIFHIRHRWHAHNLWIIIQQTLYWPACPFE